MKVSLFVGYFVLFNLQKLIFSLGNGENQEKEQINKQKNCIKKNPEGNYPPCQSH